MIHRVQTSPLSITHSLMTWPAQTTRPHSSINESISTQERPKSPYPFHDRLFPWHHVPKS